MKVFRSRSYRLKEEWFWAGERRHSAAGKSDSLRVQSPPPVVAGRVKGLSIDDVLGREVPSDVGSNEGEVLVLAKALVLPHPGLEKVREVPVSKPRPQYVDGRHLGITAILLDETPQRRQRDLALGKRWSSTLGRR